MGIFGNSTCAECGRRASILSSRLDLTDGKLLCSKCAKLIPACIRPYATNQYNYEDCMRAIQWGKDSIAQYTPIYNETFRYGSIGIDEEHGLLAPDYYTAWKTPIIRIDEIIEYHFLFAPELKEGVIGYTAKGDVEIVMTVGNPEFCFQAYLEFGAKAKATRTKLLTAEYEYGDPRGLAEMKEVLERVTRKFPTKPGLEEGFQHNRVHMFLGR